MTPMGLELSSALRAFSTIHVYGVAATGLSERGEHGSETGVGWVQSKKVISITERDGELLLKCLLYVNIKYKCFQ